MTQKALIQSQLAVDMRKPEFMTLIQKVSAYSLQASNVKVTTDGEELFANDALLALRGTQTEISTLRKEFVAFPNQYVKAINGTFKGLTDTLEKSVEHVATSIQSWRRTKEDVAETARVKAEVEAEVLAPEVESGAVEALMTKPEVSEVPNVVESEDGKVYERTTQKVVVLDKMKVIKAILSKAKNNVAFTVGLVDINQKELDHLVLKDKVRVPGTTIEEVKTLVATKK